MSTGMSFCLQKKLDTINLPRCIASAGYYFILLNTHNQMGMDFECGELLDGNSIMYFGDTLDYNNLILSNAVLEDNRMS